MTGDGDVASYMLSKMQGEGLVIHDQNLKPSNM